MQRVKVVNPNEGWIGTECYIDGNKVNNVKGVDFRVSVDEVPHFTFETIGLPEIDMAGTVTFSFTPETVQEAAVVLQNEFKNNHKSINALITSIESAVCEYKDSRSGQYILPEKIARRII